MKQGIKVESFFQRRDLALKNFNNSNIYISILSYVSRISYSEKPRCRKHKWERQGRDVEKRSSNGTFEDLYSHKVMHA